MPITHTHHCYKVFLYVEEVKETSLNNLMIDVVDMLSIDFSLILDDFSHTHYTLF